MGANIHSAGCSPGGYLAALLRWAINEALPPPCTCSVPAAVRAPPYAGHLVRAGSPLAWPGGGLRRCSSRRQASAGLGVDWSARGWDCDGPDGPGVCPNARQRIRRCLYIHENDAQSWHLVRTRQPAWGLGSTEAALLRHPAGGGPGMRAAMHLAGCRGGGD